MTRLKIDQGDDEKLNVAVRLPPAYTTPAPLEGCKLWFYVKANKDDADEVALIAKTSDVDEGIEITDAVGGLATVTIAAADTASLDSQYLGSALPWSLQVRDGSDNIITAAKGFIVISQDLIRTS